jgi:hypothetical protein
MDKKQIIDVLEITYLRIMQLHFNWRFINTIVSAPFINNDYPNLTWSLRSSFATDAYTTISSLLSTGNYSFGRLGREYPQIQGYIQIAECAIISEIDDFRNIRNQMFCHAVKKKSPDVINKIYMEFDSVFHILTRLYSDCCKELNIKDDEFRHYECDMFIKLQNEMTEFHTILFKGYLEVSKDKFLDSIRND